MVHPSHLRKIRKVRWKSRIASAETRDSPKGKRRKVRSEGGKGRKGKKGKERKGRGKRKGKERKKEGIQVIHSGATSNLIEDTLAKKRSLNRFEDPTKETETLKDFIRV